MLAKVSVAARPGGMPRKRSSSVSACAKSTGAILALVCLVVLLASREFFARDDVAADVFEAVGTPSSPGEAHRNARELATRSSGSASDASGVSAPTWPASTLPSVPGACALRVCMMQGAQSPRVYVDEYEDGSGHRLTNIIQGMAVATKNGMNFGGVVEVNGHSRKPHGHDFRQVVNDFFGASATKQLFHREVGNYTATFKNVRGLEADRLGLGDLARVHLPDANEWSYNESVPYSAYFTDELRSALLKPLLRWPSTFAPQRPTVALHLRRGDVKRGFWMAYPNAYYLGIVSKIREQWPSADVHAWSSIKVRKGDKRGKYWKSSDFDELRGDGISVHLDDENLVQVMSHFARADAFVMAPSYFSYAPAIASQSCVIYPGHDVNNHGRALDGWFDGTKRERSGYTRDLYRCLERAEQRWTANGAGTSAYEHHLAFCHSVGRGRHRRMSKVIRAMWRIAGGSGAKRMQGCVSESWRECIAQRANRFISALRRSA